MKLHLSDTRGIHSIREYRHDSIVVDDVTYTRSLIVSPGAVIAQWQHPPPAALRLHHLEPALSLDPEVILLGTGAELTFPDYALIAIHQTRGIGFEVMDTPAACRTFNILAADGRRAVAALMLGC